MNQVKKQFISTGIISILLILAGIILMIYSREVTLMNAVPLLGGVYFVIFTIVKYKKASQTVFVEYYLRLKAINKGGRGFLSETYQFEGTDKNRTPFEICISGNPKLVDDMGRNLKEGHHYQLLYLTQNGEVEDYDNVFAVNLIKGITIGGDTNA